MARPLHPCFLVSQHIDPVFAVMVLRAWAARSPAPLAALLHLRVRHIVGPLPHCRSLESASAETLDFFGVPIGPGAFRVAEFRRRAVDGLFWAGLRAALAEAVENLEPLQCGCQRRADV